MKILLPSLINNQLFDIKKGENWRNIYKKYSDNGIDRNPFIKHLPGQGIDIVQYWINHEEAQRSWADEYKIKYDSTNWYLEILKAQILKEKPDVIYNTTLTVIPYSFIEHVKKKIKKKIFWVCYYGVRRSGEFLNFKSYDLFLTGFRALERELQVEKQKYEFFPQYFDDTLCDKDYTNKRELDLTFFGSLTYPLNDDFGFSYRRRLVQELMDSANLKCFSQLNTNNNNPKEAIRQRFCALRYELFNLLNSLPYPLPFINKLPFLRQVAEWEVKPKPDYFFNPRLMKKVKEPKYGRSLYQGLRNSKITLNVHGNVNANYGKDRFAAGNIRLFEATGSGCCLLTDNLPNLEEFFTLDEEIVTYSNHHEAKDKARYLLANPTKAEDIARKGMKKAWTHHSSKIRAEQFTKFLKQHV